MENSVYSRFVERYEAGEVPWDDALPPPEVMNLVRPLTPGRALDLGSGYGRTAIYLAQQGWLVDGIDFVPQAIAEARRRAGAAKVQDRITFHVASVADLGFLDGRYQLAVDVGCLHALDETQQQGYQQGVARLLEQGAPYLLFARLQDETSDDEGPSGILQSDVESLFSAAFRLQKVEIGVTHNPENSWRSGWFWFVRK